MCLSLLRDWEYHSMMIFNLIVQQSHWQKFECLVGPSLFLLWWEHLTRFVGKNKEGILFMPLQKQTKSLITGNFPFSKILLFCLFSLPQHESNFLPVISLSISQAKTSFYFSNVLQWKVNSKEEDCQYDKVSAEKNLTEVICILLSTCLHWEWGTQWFGIGICT